MLKKPWLTCKNRNRNSCRCQITHWKSSYLPTKNGYYLHWLKKGQPDQNQLNHSTTFCWFSATPLGTRNIELCEFHATQIQCTKLLEMPQRQFDFLLASAFGSLRLLSRVYSLSFCLFFSLSILHLILQLSFRRHDFRSMSYTCRGLQKVQSFIRSFYTRK